MESSKQFQGKQATERLILYFDKGIWNLFPPTLNFFAVCEKAYHNHTDQHSLYLLLNYERIIMKMKNGNIDFQSYNSNVPLC